MPRVWAKWAFIRDLGAAAYGTCGYEACGYDGGGYGVRGYGQAAGDSAWRMRIGRGDRGGRGRGGGKAGRGGGASVRRVSMPHAALARLWGDIWRGAAIPHAAQKKTAAKLVQGGGMF